MTNVALIVAAGRGHRMAGTVKLPKQYRKLGGEAVLTHSLRAFVEHARIDRVMAVIHADDGSLYAKATTDLGAKLMDPVHGGRTRQQSVHAGLAALSTLDPTHILIHDGARPLVSAAIIDRVLDALTNHAGAIAALPVTDTLKRQAPTGEIVDTLDRAGIWRAQTPQGFRFKDIVLCHDAAATAGRTDFTDDAAIATWQGIEVALVEGATRNRKLTNREDMALAAREIELEALAQLGDVRTGTGFDVHRFGAGDHVTLCGVKISFDKGLEGHSDADVGLHALTDALYGAVGDGDIGSHFPPDDPEWRGAASEIFLADAARRVRELGGTIANLDITLICEAPKIAPHREAMRARIAEITGLDITRIGVKATTTEGLGFPGRGEGIAAMAGATVRLPLLGD